jgi:hypothetical protein
MSLIFSAMGQDWKESFDMIHKPQRSSDAASIVYTPHVILRCRELGRVLKSVCRSFDQLQSKEHDTFGSGQNREDIVLASVMPKEAKKALASLLVKIAVVLQRGVRCVEMTILKGNCSDDAVHESIAVLMAWLLSESSESDVSQGLRKWFFEEREKEALGSISGHHHADGAILLGRLSKALCLMEDLENGLRKLHHLVTVSKRQEPDSMARLRSTEAIVYLAAKGMGYRSMVERFTFDEIIQRKIKFLSDANADWYRMALATEFSVKRKRRVETSGAKKRPRKGNIVRSGNRVVDTWLAIDQCQYQDEFDGDAYTDLEDFLVEG